MIKVNEIAFVAYPVKDKQKARDFSEGVLNLKLESSGDFPDGFWIEYEIGRGTLARAAEPRRVTGEQHAGRERERVPGPGVERRERVEGELHGVFIRAPWVEAVDEGADGVEVLARVSGGSATGRIVAVRQGNLLATSFHPELTGDHRVHGVFAELVRAAR